MQLIGVIHPFAEVSMNRAMYRKLTMLAVTALLSLFALEENAANPTAEAPLSGVVSVLSIDDSPRGTHP